MTAAPFAQIFSQAYHLLLIFLQMIRPAKHILDERPLLASLQTNIARQKGVHAQIIQLMPARLKAVTQIELKILITKNNCFLMSANGSLCNQLKMQKAHIQKQLTQRYNDLPKLVIRKANYQDTINNAIDKPLYWQANSLNENAIKSLTSAAQHISHKPLADSLNRLAELQKTKN